MKTYLNPSYVSKFDWGHHDLEQITVVVNELNRQDNPFNLLAALADSLPKVMQKDLPNVGAMTRHPPSASPIERVWAFAYLAGSRPNEKSLKVSLKRISELCQADRALYIACAYMEQLGVFDVRGWGDGSSGFDKKTRRESFFEERWRVPALKEMVASPWDVDEVVSYLFQDLMRGAMQELEVG